MSGDPRFVRFACGSPSDRALHARGGCLGCRSRCFQGTPAPRTTSRIGNEGGLFAFEHAEDDEPGSRPYVRVSQPRSPLHVDMLPAELREKLEAVTFAGACFARDHLLQPAAHWPCDSSEPWWLDQAGEHRERGVLPVPGDQELTPWDGEDET